MAARPVYICTKEPCVYSKPQSYSNCRHLIEGIYCGCEVAKMEAEIKALEGKNGK